MVGNTPREKGNKPGIGPVGKSKSKSPKLQGKAEGFVRSTAVLGKKGVQTEMCRSACDPRKEPKNKKFPSRGNPLAVG